MNKEIKQTKQLELQDLPPLKEQIKDIVLAFDVNTNKTGYCFLVNGRPMQLGLKEYLSLGTIRMVEHEKYVGQASFSDKTPVERQKPKTYTNYGDRLFWGSGRLINAIGSIVGDMFTQINPYYAKKETELPKIYIVFEISEIPQRRGQKNYQSITNVRKLALYVGAIVQEIYTQINLHGYFVATEKNTEVKLIKPNEWQFRMWAPTDKETGSKEKSILFANRHLKSWGLQPTDDDDLADAINMSIVAKEVRDNLFVSSFNITKKELVLKTLPRDIWTLQSKIVSLEKEAHEKYVNHLLKIKESKNSKYDYEAEKNKPPIIFLPKSKYERWVKLSSQKKQKQELLTKLKGKVYGTPH